MAEEDKITPQTSKETQRRSTTSSPLIFISHDNRDAELAEEFSKLLISVSAGVLKSFRSSDRKGSQGIEYGVEWYPELMSRLEAASDVVCLLTTRSLDRPWILYEAGVAKGKLDTPVHGVALGIPLNKANTGPFAQFHNCDDKEESLTKLVIQLLKRIPDSDPDKEAIQVQVQSFKKKVDTLLKKLGAVSGTEASEPTTDASSVAKLFEEVKVMFQDLPSRIESRLNEGIAPIRRSKFRKFHPMMIEDIMHMSSMESNDPFGLIIIASFFKDELPWLYEMIMELYRSVQSGDSKTISDSIQRLRRTMKMIMKGPFLEEFGMFSKDSFMFIQELPMMIDHYINKFEIKKEKK